MTVARRLLAIACLAGLVGCSTTPGPTGGPTPGPGASDSSPENAAEPPSGGAVSFEKADVSADGLVLTLQFVGGKEYNPTDPCTNHYFGWAHGNGDALDAKIVDDTPPRDPLGGTGVACDAVGYPRTVSIRLESPFHGTRVNDLAGYVHFVRAPEGLAELQVPAGWTLVREADVQESPTGRWERTWTLGGAERTGSSKGTIDFYQSFDGAASVTGGDEQRKIQVNGTPGVLFRQADAGELVIVWLIGKNGLALVVNETDFPIDMAIELAESAKIP